jgi:TusA-related sulfurtransferase
MKNIEVGDQIEVKVTDPGFPSDIKSWVKQTRHTCDFDFNLVTYFNILHFLTNFYNWPWTLKTTIVKCYDTQEEYKSIEIKADRKQFNYRGLQCPGPIVKISQEH